MPMLLSSKVASSKAIASHQIGDLHAVKYEFNWFVEHELHYQQKVDKQERIDGK